MAALPTLLFDSLADALGFALQRQERRHPRSLRQVMSEHMRDRSGRSRLACRRLGTNARLLSTVLLLGTACVRWQAVPGPSISARPLPRWVQVTTRDSAHYMLEDARVVPGDSLVGRPGNAASSVRLPIAEIAHLEARVPSGPRSIGMGVVVIGGFFGLVALIGRAGGGWD
jgi:hypothetical protein